jgi:hypothetical protein
MKLNEISDTLGSLGWEMVAKKLAAGELIAVEKSTLVAMFTEKSQKDWLLDTKRHALLEAIHHHDGRDYPTADFLMPCKTSHWVTAPMVMGPSQQEGWMMKPIAKGWLAWREV